MTNIELQTELRQFPDDMEVRLMLNCHDPKSAVIAMSDENIMLTTDTAYVDENAPEDEWNTDDGKVELGDGTKYLLINPMIL